ncbi:MAG: hypothetical protein CBC40_04495 [bacterium TMED80]|nr:MAG: hypothetical protein CBC40_04495 [bacterium TMED80]
MKVGKTSILYLTPILLIIPYFGHLKLNNVIIGIAFLIFCLMSAISLSFSKISDSNIKIILKSYTIQFLFIPFSIIQSMIFLEIQFTFNDYFELIRPILNIVIIIPFYVLFKKISEKKSLNFILIWISIVTFLNFFLSLISKFDISFFLPIIEAYGEGSIYSFGYSKFRAFGLVGQPGKNAIFCNIIVLISVYIFKKTSSRLPLLLVILNGFSILLTLSRVGLLIFFIIVIINFLNFEYLRKNFLKVFLIFSITSFVLLNLSTEFFDFKFLFRGLEGSDSYGTLGKRLYLKKWAFTLISENLNSILFGLGPCKDYLSSLSTYYASDLTLRQPDSSATLWMLRYGFLGMIIFYFPHFSILFSKRFFLTQVTVLVIIISNFDPPYHEPKTQLIYWMIIVFLFRFEKQKNYNE